MSEKSSDQSSAIAVSGRTPYRGRFAPSPTGPLHFGSLVAAVASYLDAQAVGGEWLLRIEDLDTPRVVPGSADLILRTLDAFGFEWDEPLLYQSTRTEAYSDALERLLQSSNAFQCSCSRSEIQAAQPENRAPGDELYYPGWCRAGPRSPARELAVRFPAPDRPIRFDDRIQGPITIDLATDCGDFVIRRRDGLFAYQLAVVVDDDAQDITHIVRGADLLGSTPRQIALQQALGFAQPEYAHVPLVTDDNGIKLSKSAGAGALDVRHPSLELWRALRFLRQSPPLELRLNGLPLIWEWAKRNWQMRSLRGLRWAIAEPF
jgi:glutamyl-Q tRNA(Asp) synthetase